ncbi:MAG: hypothetical protein JWL81_1731 [Verrucomicrobiales bacterium]|nr:hypothetical protein [Verrucomicrobiales bacterium]
MHRKHFLKTLAATGIPLAAGGLPFIGTALAQGPAAPRVPDSVFQLVVAIADNWNSSRARLLPFSRPHARAPWQPAWPGARPVMLGKAGLAWGNGAIPVPHGQPGIPSKRERDQRAPAGLFKIGTLYGYDPASLPGLRIPSHRVTTRDCWVDDPTLPSYNRHILVDPGNPPPWYEKQKMRLGDFAYEFLLEIRHNSDPPFPGHGSAIFFHIRRGPDKPSHGCTTMARPDLVNLIRWLDARANPHYVLLPRAAYAALGGSWGLPPAF